jgi:outer membrane receptor protein involved in Fe transport
VHLAALAFVRRPRLAGEAFDRRNNRSKAALLLNAGVAYQFNKRWSLSADLFNLLNRRNDDITYAYISRITPTGTATFTNVFHPAEPGQMRFRLERTF